jgi:hypothetical protein
MTFCELVGVIEICVLPLCAIPSTGIVARDRSAAQGRKHLPHGRVALSRTFQGYPAKPLGAFPILPILCLILLGILISCTQRVASRYASFEGGARDGERNEKNGGSRSSGDRDEAIIGAADCCAYEKGRGTQDCYTRWDEFCMSPLAPQRSMKTGSSLTKLC